MATVRAYDATVPFRIRAGILGPLKNLWRKLFQISHRQPRCLRLCESLPLGDRRFVAVIEFDESRFLVGGTTSSIVLLATLENRAETDRAQPTDSHSLSPREEIR